MRNFPVRNSFFIKSPFISLLFFIPLCEIFQSKIYFLSKARSSLFYFFIPLCEIFPVENLFFYQKPVLPFPFFISPVRNFAVRNWFKINLIPEVHRVLVLFFTVLQYFQFVGKNKTSPTSSQHPIAVQFSLIIRFLSVGGKPFVDKNEAFLGHLFLTKIQRER